MNSVLQDLTVSRNYLIRQTPADYKVGIVLGTGLSSIREEVTQAKVVPYQHLFQYAGNHDGAPSHKGELVLGKINGVKVVLMDGRFHYYEGYTMSQVVGPIRLMKLLGVETLIITSAVGGLGDIVGGGAFLEQNEGDVVVLRDHINLMGDSPLRGPNIDELGPRFPDMTFAYDRDLREQVKGIYWSNYDQLLPEVTYAAVAGPQLETLAEYQALKDMGADIVGMSVVPEVIAAAHMSMKVLALSVITDVVDHIHPKVATIEAIIAAANKAAPKLRTVIMAILDSMPKSTTLTAAEAERLAIEAKKTEDLQKLKAISDNIQDFPPLGQRLLIAVARNAGLPARERGSVTTSHGNQAGRLWEKWWYWDAEKGYQSMNCHSSQAHVYHTREEFVKSFLDEAAQYSTNLK
jgi:purine-nucleoside phosphorylase